MIDEANERIYGIQARMIEESSSRENRYKIGPEEKCSTLLMVEINVVIGGRTVVK